MFYELRRSMELLSLNNPNILELLNTPESAIIDKHPYLSEIKLELILSKRCSTTFGKFALSNGVGFWEFHIAGGTGFGND